MGRYLHKQNGEYIADSEIDHSEFLRRMDVYRSGRCKPDYCRFFDGDHLVPAGNGCSSENVTTMFRVGKKQAGRLLDRRTHDEFPKPQLR